MSALGDKQLHRWLGGYARHLFERARSPSVEGTRHVLFAFCDHWEPLWGKPDEHVADERVRTWARRYPELASEFRDADGRPPRHSFFFPGEEYRPKWLDTLGDLARAGLGEVELHLHHDGDTSAKLRHDIERYLELLGQHGHFSRGPDGKPRFGFIHGNWSLANSRDDGRWCGVDDELPLLFDLGCYADYTFPSAPDQCQPNIVNQIYWPTGDLTRPRCYERGVRSEVGTLMRDRILMIQGPLALVPRRAKIPFRIESSAVTANDPATPSRIKSWVAQAIHVAGRPDWIFVKVHTHGAPEDQSASLLGEPGRAMHRELSKRFNDGEHWKLHYVTAREMFNIAVAAMQGEHGDPNDYRNHELLPPPICT